MALTHIGTHWCHYSPDDAPGFDVYACTTHYPHLSGFVYRPVPSSQGWSWLILLGNAQEFTLGRSHAPTPRNHVIRTSFRPVKTLNAALWDVEAVMRDRAVKRDPLRQWGVKR